MTLRLKVQALRQFRGDRTHFDKQLPRLSSREETVFAQVNRGDGVIIREQGKNDVRAASQVGGDGYDLCLRESRILGQRIRCFPSAIPKPELPTRFRITLCGPAAHQTKSSNSKNILLARNIERLHARLDAPADGGASEIQLRSGIRAETEDAAHQCCHNQYADQCAHGSVHYRLLFGHNSTSHATLALAREPDVIGLDMTKSVRQTLP